MSDDVFQALHHLSFDYRAVIGAFLKAHPGWTENTHGYGAPGEPILETDLEPTHGSHANVGVRFDIQHPTNMDGRDTVLITAFTSHGQQRQETLKGKDLAALPDRDSRLKTFEGAFLRVTSIISHPS